MLSILTILKETQATQYIQKAMANQKLHYYPNCNPFQTNPGFYMSAVQVFM